MLDKLFSFIFTRNWNFREFKITDSGCRESMRRLLRKQCPLCGQTLTNHAYSEGLACTRINDADQATMRAALVDGPLDSLPLEGVNDPTSDIIAYMLLRCPNSEEYTVIEHFSGAGMYGDERVTVVPGIPGERMKQLVNHVADWKAL